MSPLHNWFWTLYYLTMDDVILSQDVFQERPNFVFLLSDIAIYKKSFA